MVPYLQGDPHGRSRRCEWQILPDGQGGFQQPALHYECDALKESRGLLRSISDPYMQEDTWRTTIMTVNALQDEKYFELSHRLVMRSTPLRSHEGLRPPILPEALRALPSPGQSLLHGVLRTPLPVRPVPSLAVLRLL